MRIYASILAADIMNIENEIRRAVSAGVDGFHIDVTDGHFARDITFGPTQTSVIVSFIRKLAKTNINVHIMADNPGELLELYLPLDIDTVIIHPETCPEKLDSILHQIADGGKKVGFAARLDCPDKLLNKYIDRIDMINLCAVKTIGIGGQTFCSDAVKRLLQLNAIMQRNNKRCDMLVDGGINGSNIAALAQAGADCAIIGTALFGSSDMASALYGLRQLADNAEQALSG